MERVEERQRTLSQRPHGELAEDQVLRGNRLRGRGSAARARPAQRRYMVTPDKERRYVGGACIPSMRKCASGYGHAPTRGRRR